MAGSSRLVLRSLLLLGLPVFGLPFGAGCGGTSSDEAVAAIRVDPCLPFAVVVDAAASLDQRRGVAEALDAWSAVAAVRGTVTADSGAGGEALPLGFQAAAAPSHGFYDPATGRIFVNEDLAARPLAVTIAHELGHAFGLVHVTDRPSVMNAGNVDLEPSATDAAVLATAWGDCVSPAN